MSNPDVTLQEAVESDEYEDYGPEDLEHAETELRNMQDGIQLFQTAACLADMLRTGHLTIAEYDDITDTLIEYERDEVDNPL
jgi:hypothetical protein